MHSPLPLAYSGLLSHTTFASSSMYIGEFARLAGTTPKAVRLYGLLPEPRRRDKYRAYRVKVLEWASFIREAQ